jgi:alkylation response protein AidB-like acyl-CoA dehydrogenase
MDFSLSDEQEALRELARRIFAERTSHERTKQLEAKGGWFDPELWAELCRANLTAIALPEEVGGAGLGVVEAVLVLEELGRHLGAAPLYPTVVLGGLPLAAFGTREQKEKWLRPVAGGDAVLTAALEEPAGFDPARPRTTARRDGDGWRLDGEKTCVQAAQLASAMLVPARTGRAPRLLPVKPLRVRRLARDAARDAPRAALARRASRRVGAGALLGRPEQGAEILEWLRERALLGLAAIALGVADAAMRQTADYVIQRKQFGRPIGSFQSAQHRIADAWIDVECMRSVVLEAAWRLSVGLPAGLHVRAAKWWAAMAADRVTHTAQHLHGGIGADVDYPIHRHSVVAAPAITLGGPRQLEEARLPHGGRPGPEAAMSIEQNKQIARDFVAALRAPLDARSPTPSPRRQRLDAQLARSRDAPPTIRRSARDPGGVPGACASGSARSRPRRPRGRRASRRRPASGRHYHNTYLPDSRAHGRSRTTQYRYAARPGRAAGGGGA